LKDECRIIYGLICRGINGKWNEEIAMRLSKTLATYRNGKKRKGKYKRISRSKKHQKLLNLANEEDMMEVYQREAKERREHQKAIDEERNNFWDRIRRAEYLRRRRSEPFIRIPNLETEDYEENPR
jgi:hypothetical protein